MPRTTQFMPPKDLKWGYLPNYPYTNRSFKSALRGNQWVAAMPIMADVPDQRYLDMGLTHLIQNVGQPNNHLPVSQQACMQNADFLINGIGKPFNQWTETDVRNAVIQGLAQRGGGFHFFLGQIMEAIGNSGITTQANWRNSTLHRVCWQQIQTELDKIGGRAYGDYDGHMRLLRFDDYANPNDFRAALKNDNDALTLAKAATPFGDEFFTGEGYRYRHGNHKIYQTGNVDVHKVTNSFLTGMAVDKRARRAVGTGRRVAVVPFCGYDETLGQDAHSQRYERAVPAGGTAIANTFPMWSYVHQAWTIFNAWLDDFDIYSWETEARFGSNPNVVTPDNIGQFGEVIFSYSGPAQRAGTSYYYNTGNVGYPISPMGVQDILALAGEMVKFSRDRSGGYDSKYISHRVNGGGLTNVADDYLIDRYFDRQGECKQIGFGNQIVIAFCATGWDSLTQKEVSVPMPSGPAVEFTAYAHVPVLIHVDLTQN